LLHFDLHLLIYLLPKEKIPLYYINIIINVYKKK